MSRISKQEVAFTNAELLQRACEVLDITYEAHGRAFFYRGDATGQLVYLKGWTYPVVISEDGSKVTFDNLDTTRLDELKVEYSKQVILHRARLQGYTVKSITTNANGEVVVKAERR